jgi:hypothetical protein
LERIMLTCMTLTSYALGRMWSSQSSCGRVIPLFINNNNNNNNNNV